MCIVFMFGSGGVVWCVLPVRVGFVYIMYTPVPRCCFFGSFHFRGFLLILISTALSHLSFYLHFFVLFFYIDERDVLMVCFLSRISRWNHHFNVLLPKHILRRSHLPTHGRFILSLFCLFPMQISPIFR